MAFRVNTNVSALNTQRWLGISGTAQAKALERLSSGYKINKASDDAAGIAIATKLDVKSVAMTKSIDNGNQALAMLQTAEGGMDQISNILTRLKEIATQSASDNTTTRGALEQERSNLETEINKIAANTRYGTTQLLQGSKTLAATQGASITAGNGIVNIDVSAAVTTGAGTTNFTLTATNPVAGGAYTVALTNGTTTQTITVTGLTGLNQATANFGSLGISITFNAAGNTIAAAGGGFSISAGTSAFDYQVGDTNLGENQIQASMKNFDAGNAAVLALTGDINSKTAAQAYMTTVDTAITNLTTERGKLGASMNMISYHVANLESMNENIKASISTVKDADFAAEMANFTKNQILQQSGVAMLAQANSIPQQVLSLLKG
jgi:flagellin